MKRSCISVAVVCHQWPFSVASHILKRFKPKIRTSFEVFYFLIFIFSYTSKIDPYLAKPNGTPFASRIQVFFSVWLAGKRFAFTACQKSKIFEHCFTIAERSDAGKEKVMHLSRCRLSSKISLRGCHLHHRCEYN